VGVVANERFHGLTEAPAIGVYTPLAQTPSATGAGVLLLQTPSDPAALETEANAVIHEIDRDLAVFGVEPLPTTLSRSIGQRRFTMLLLGLFAGVALLLAAVGVHGVLSYAVTQRRRELGIRIALGARTPDIVALVVRGGLTLTVAGLVIGLAGAVALTRFLASQLFGITATDPATFATVAAVILVVAATSIVAPARRAATLDPVVTLRAE
jgi:predicted lysophospholipase L1 biosynthesis ABC-type transport system permease subunit